MSIERRNGLIFILVAAFGYACLPVVVRHIYNISDLVPTDIALLRFILATPLVWLFIRVQNPQARFGKPQGISWRGLIIMGTMYVGAALAAFAGLELIPASTYVVLFYTYPAMVALLSFFLGKRLKVQGWIALGLTLIGVIFTVPDFSQLGGDGIGIFIALLNAFLVAVYFIFSGRVFANNKNVIGGAAWTMNITLVMLLLLSPFFGLNLPQNSDTWIAMLFLATICTAVPILTINLGIQLIGASQSAIISSIEPAVTMLLAFVFLNEVIIAMQWIGVVFIIAGVILLQIPIKWLRKKN